MPLAKTPAFAAKSGTERLLKAVRSRSGEIIMTEEHVLEDALVKETSAVTERSAANDFGDGVG